MPYVNSSVTGDVAIVTGAASGIGQAIAIALAEAGAKVGCADLSSSDSAEPRRVVRHRRGPPRRRWLLLLVMPAAIARPYVTGAC